MFGKGMEMMITNIIKSMGIDPNELMEKGNEVIAKVDQHLTSFDNRLSRIEKALNIKEENDGQRVIEVSAE